MDGLLIVNEQHLRRALTEYQKHYNAARPHRSLGQLTPAQADTRPPEPIDLADHRVRRNQVLSGLTHEYYVAALPTLLLKSRSPVRIVFPSPTGSSVQGSVAFGLDAFLADFAGDRLLAPGWPRRLTTLGHGRDAASTGRDDGGGHEDQRQAGDHCAQVVADRVAAEHPEGAVAEPRGCSAMTGRRAVLPPSSVTPPRLVFSRAP